MADDGMTVGQFKEVKNSWKQAKISPPLYAPLLKGRMDAEVSTFGLARAIKAAWTFRKAHGLGKSKHHAIDKDKALLFGGPEGLRLVYSDGAALLVVGFGEELGPALVLQDGAATMLLDRAVAWANAVIKLEGKFQVPENTTTTIEGLIASTSFAVGAPLELTDMDNDGLIEAWPHFADDIRRLPGKQPGTGRFHVVSRMLAACAAAADALLPKSSLCLMVPEEQMSPGLFLLSREERAMEAAVLFMGAKP